MSAASRDEFFFRLSGAQDIVGAQAHCSPSDALVMIVDRALKRHETVGAMVDAVLDRAMRFGD